MEGWRECTLGEMADIQNGFAFKSVDFLGYPIEGSLPVIKIKNVANGDVSLNDVQHHRFDPQYAAFRVSKNDVLIALTGNHPDAETQVVGAVSMYKHVQNSLLNQRVGKFIVREGIDKSFLYYLLKNKSTHERIAATSSGSASQANISTNNIKCLKFTIPEFSIQKAIAAVLSSLDDKIDLLHRQNKTLEVLAQTLFRQWFVEEADESWEEGTFFDEFYILMGQSPQGKTFNESASGLPMFQGNADFGFRFPTNRIYTDSPIRVANAFDTLVSVRAPVGAQNMAQSKCCIGRGLSAIRYKNNSSYYRYTYYRVMSLLDKIKLYNDEGTVFGSISKSDFEKIPTIVPPESDVASCELRLKNVDDKLVNNISQIRTLTKLRDTLLPKLMSGEVRVEM